VSGFLVLAVFVVWAVEGEEDVGLAVDGAGLELDSFLSPLRGWLVRLACDPRLAPWAAFFRSFGAGASIISGVGRLFPSAM
jgi:hypothetical protein